MFSSIDESGLKISYLEAMKPTLVQTSESFSALMLEMISWPYITFDFEATGLSFLHHDIVGVALTSKDKICYYIPLRHKIGQNLDPALVLPALYDIFQRIPTVAHNIKFDFNMMYWALKSFGISNPDFNATHDTMLMFQILFPHERGKAGLKALVERFFGVQQASFKMMVDEGEDFSFVSIEDALIYACGDVYWTTQLFEKFKPLLASIGLVNIYKLEMSCVKAFAEMERIGIPIDFTKIESALLACRNRLEILTKEIYALAGHDFNIASPTELSIVLFEEQSIPPPRNKSKEGHYSTDAACLEARQEYEIVSNVLEYREISKLISAFLEKATEVVCEDGRLHAGFNQLGTRSGRASSSGGIGPKGINPKLNLHQLPHEKQTAAFRSMLIPPKDYYWLCADYQQIEYRLMACMAGEEELMVGIRQGIDFHTLTSSLLFKVPVEQVTKELRYKGKTLNFGISYGMSAFSLGRILGIPAKEAQKFIDDYFTKLKKLSKFIEKIQRQAYETGQVRTAFNRIRYFENLQQIKEEAKLKSKLRAAFNTVIQGTAADINKMGLAAVFEAKKSYGDKILLALNVHDEISLFVHNSIPLDEAKAVLYCMEQEFKDRPWVPFSVDMKFGSSYEDLSSVSGIVSPSSIPKESEDIFVSKPIIVDIPFDRVVIIKIDEVADFKSIKLVCSPAKPFPYRVILSSGYHNYLLPSQFTINPTQKSLNYLKKLSGVQDVLIKVDDGSRNK